MFCSYSNLKSNVANNNITHSNIALMAYLHSIYDSFRSQNKTKNSLLSFFLLLLKWQNKSTKQKAKIIVDKYQKYYNIYPLLLFYYSILYYSMCLNKNERSRRKKNSTTAKQMKQKLRVFRYTIQMHFYVYMAGCSIVYMLKTKGDSISSQNFNDNGK